MIIIFEEMTMKLTTLMLAGAAMLSTTAANAQDNWPNWYVGLKGAVPFVPDQDVSRSGVSAGEIDFDDGTMYSAAIGYMPNGGNMRYELEYFNSENSLSGAATLFPGQLSGDMTVDALMLNAFYDFTNETLITPYIGAGIGGARTSLQSVDLALSGGETDTQMAYQLMTGLSYEPKILRNVAFSVGYRYFSIFDNAEFANGANQTDIDFDSHNVEVGARFRF